MCWRTLLLSFCEFSPYIRIPPPFTLVALYKNINKSLNAVTILTIPAQSCLFGMHSLLDVKPHRFIRERNPLTVTVWCYCLWCLSAKTGSRFLKTTPSVWTMLLLDAQTKPLCCWKFWNLLNVPTAVQPELKSPIKNTKMHRRASSCLNSTDAFKRCHIPLISIC